MSHLHVIIWSLQALLQEASDHEGRYYECPEAATKCRKMVILGSTYWDECDAKTDHRAKSMEVSNLFRGMCVWGKWPRLVHT